MIWAGKAYYLIGPYFFDRPVNAASYSAMLETWLVTQLRDRGLLDDVWLQHDGAPAHFVFSVRDVLTEHFPGRWIGRGSPTSPAPLPWPPRSPDVTTPNNSCGVLSREEWLRVATTTTICAELCKAPFAQLLQKYSNVCHIGHGVCVSSIKMHIRIQWTCNQGVRK